MTRGSVKRVYYVRIFIKFYSFYSVIRQSRKQVLTWNYWLTNIKLLYNTTVQIPFSDTLKNISNQKTSRIQMQRKNHRLYTLNNLTNGRSFVLGFAFSERGRSACWAYLRFVPWRSSFGNRDQSKMLFRSL